MARVSMAWVAFLTFAAATTLVQGKLTVHVVPHTHDDVGWLKTVDEYYAGKNNSIQHAYVKMILDTVIDNLRANPDRRFTYVEQAFFFRWWRQQTPEIQEATKQLVKSGQLSFTNGGWCMHDEAAPHYVDMIDQTTLGHKFLMDNFGFAPKTGWQLDPFGHSATQAALLSAEVGFAGLFFGRIDYQDLQLRINDSSAEFVWRASPSLGDDAQVFSGLTGSYGGNYGPPSGLNWNEDSSDEPVQDDPLLEDYNVKSRVDDFVNFALWQANHTRGQHIMFTMGSDFQYENAHEWFSNLDKIIHYVNLDGRVQATYSTPEMYLAAKVQELQTVQWPLKTDDFFPYADGPHQFWTGYFTSRPALKRFIRDSSAFLQVVRQIDTFGAAHNDVNPGIEVLAEAMGVVQHHDAVSGTAKQHVTFDYASRVAHGRDAALAGIQATLAGLLDVNTAAVCDLRNVSVCPSTQGLAAGASVDFVLWNGLAQARSQLVELPVAAGNYQLTEIGGSAADVQLVPALSSINNYGEPAGGSDTMLLFTASVPPLGAKAYRLTRSSGESPAVKKQDRQDPADDVVILENENLALQFCDGSLCKITNKKSGISIAANQNWLWYNASEGDKESGQKSGAYIFRPTDSNALPASLAKVDIKVVQGALANEVHQTIGDWITQRIRLPAGSSHAEITYTVGPVPVVFHGMEVISRITTDIKNADVCYTDSNGREMLKRQRDFRPTWKLNQTEPVAGNYFPVSTAMFIKDDKAQLTVLTDTSQAGTGCVQEGQLELMVHRRLLLDDGRGVGEPLNETRDIRPYVGDNQGQHYGPGLVIRGRHWLTLSPPAQAASGWRPLMDKLYMPLQPFFSSSAVSKGGFSALQQALPPNVQIVSLSRWDDKVLLRLAHQFGLGEDEALSAPAVVDLGALFAGQKVVSAEERGLAATISREEVLARRVAWKIEGEGARAKPAAEKAPKGMPMDDLQVTLGPLQIRTFWVKLAPASAAGEDAQASRTFYA